MIHPQYFLFVQLWLRSLAVYGYRWSGSGVTWQTDRGGAAGKYDLPAVTAG